jgi:Ca-activated chloride channel homolog
MRFQASFAFVSLLLFALLGAGCEPTGGLDVEGDDEPIEGTSGHETQAGDGQEASTGDGPLAPGAEAALARVRSGDVPKAVQITGGADPTQGVMQVTRGEEIWELPLVHTDVDAEISGFIADVEVRQVYANPFDEPIEAVYLFPLPDDGAVDAMEMRVGDRVIVGEIHRREEARQIYEEARDAGKTAALLDQERPNIFQQSVANILPGDAVEVIIHVVQPLKYESGGYEWAFPMVVGPRFIPGQGTGNSGATDPIEDAARLDAPVSETRTGNDISLRAWIDAGMAIQDVRSTSHEVDITREDAASVGVAISPSDSIPNKDFILRYDLAGEAPEAALLTHRSEELGGYFMLMIQPQADEFVTDDVVTPKEMVFVVDTSGSMRGYPLTKAKEAMSLAITEMNPDDRFYVMDFNTTVSSLSPTTLPNTKENRKRGLQYVERFEGERGTNMLEGIKAALDLEKDPELLRTVLFMTDGYIGNESQILSAVEEHLGDSRLYSFGVGSSVNRYLLDRMSKVGRGHVQYLRQDEEAEPAIQAFYERIRNPLLTDVQIEWEGIEVVDVYPDPVPDLFAGQPVILVGRYEQPGEGIVRVRGKIRGREHVQEIAVTFPDAEPEHDALASLWARTVIEDLESRQYKIANPAIEEEITELALRYQLMSRYTSFVAVEETVVNEDGAPKTVRVPLETPDGVSFEGIFGDKDADNVMLGGSATSASAYGGSGGMSRTSAPPPALQAEPRRPEARRRIRTRDRGPSSGVPVLAEESEDEAAYAPEPVARMSFETTGDWSRADYRLQQDLRARLEPIEAAWRARSVEFPDNAGHWLVEVDVNRDGKVTDLRIVEDTVNLKSLHEEIFERAKRWWLTAATDGKAATFTFRLEFHQP